MRIKTLLSQHRRDFRAVFVCEHCKAEETRSGYDDDYFHNTVIPGWKCKSCGKTSPDNYEPAAPKYAAWETI